MLAYYKLICMAEGMDFRPHKSVIHFGVLNLIDLDSENILFFNLPIRHR